MGSINHYVKVTKFLVNLLPQILEENLNSSKHRTTSLPFWKGKIWFLMAFLASLLLEKYVNLIVILSRN